MKKTIKIALLGTQHDYKEGILPLIIKHLGYKIEWVKHGNSDLTVYGAFWPQHQKPFRWAPRPARPLIGRIVSNLNLHVAGRKNPPITLFHTSESLRHNIFNTDYSISFDLGIQHEKHLRLPYWMELVDWSHEGITGNVNPRYGRLLCLNLMRAPLGNAFLARTQKAAMITSHLLEPRKMLYEAIDKSIGVAGYGPYFDKAIKNHHHSNFTKDKILKEFAFNLCPENQLYPGYYTEKIPESFMSGALPLGWVDSNVHSDFNPDAFINLEPMTWNCFESLNDLLHSKRRLESFCDQPLITNNVSLEPAKFFIHGILQNALS